MSSAPSGKIPRRAVYIGKYEVVSHIATGGMGAVYKARDTELRRDVALKILAPEMAGRPGLLERFRREARHAARLRHENIVAIYEFGESDGTYFLALEFVDGIDLAEYIDRKGKLDPEEARLITLQATRALEHAHSHGIIHRDIKPSNFLIARPNGGLIVKMTDLGLARETGDEDFRVTRAGTTVGTIDYIAPEQARDSTLADIRSDLYSLGCTLFHMLTGQAPFSEGGLTERLYKHIEAEPPNVLDFNPRVPPALCAVLYRLLAKKPEDRYQTPAQLVHDLLHLDMVAVPKQAPARHDLLAALADIETPNRRGRRKTRVDTRAQPRPRPVNRKLERETRESPAARTRTIIIPNHLKPWLLGACGILLAVILAIVLVVALRAGLKTSRADLPENIEPVVGESPRVSVAGDADLDRSKKPDPPIAVTVVGKPKEVLWPALYDPAAPLNVEQLKQEFVDSWAAPRPLPAETLVFRVSRLPHSGGGPHFDSLAVACAAAPADRVTVIEIHDNGPIFAPAVTVRNRSLVIRAANGFRPLLLWDTSAGIRDSSPSPGAEAFLTVSQGNLVLENLELAVRREGIAESAAFLCVVNGDLVARGCAFSVAGKNNGPMAIARLEGPAGSTATRCRLSRCFGRGGQLQIADIAGPAAQISMENCLFVGGSQPLVHVRGYVQPAPTTIRVSYSTLIGRQTLLQVKPASNEDATPAVHWFGWDSVLARSGDQSGGTLVVLDDKAEIHGIQWRATNCCYAGWKTLLAGRDTILSTDLQSWQRLGVHTEAERATPDAWPAVVAHDPAEILPEVFRLAPYPETPVGYAASLGTGPLGCDLALLPAVRDNWVSLTQERFALPSLNVLDASIPPIPTGGDGRYHGERLDLNRTDLGAYLKEVQESRKLGPKVVLHLSGSGERKSSPIRWRGADLILYVEPPVRDGITPLTLTPLDSDPSGHTAWIEVEHGNLDLMGLEVRCPDFKLALLPPYLLRVQGGNLRLHGCRLYGPRAQAPDSFRGLICFEGSGQSSTDRAAICTVNESVLVTGKNALQTNGTGARLAMHQSVIVAGADGLFFEPGATKTKMNLSFELDHSTVAAQHQVLRVGPAAGTDVPMEPFVVQAQACAFLAPFAGHDSGLVACEGDSLARGLLVWQGEGNVYDKRLHSLISLGGESAERPQPFTVWTRLWGPANERRSFLNLVLTNTWKWEPLQWERLLLPEIKPPSAGSGPKPRPGADLAALGLLPKPIKAPK